MVGQIPHRYGLGHTVHISFELYDESGVGEVVAIFAHNAGEGTDITLQGHGRGEEHSTVNLETNIEEHQALGLYTLRDLYVRDSTGNQVTLHPTTITPQFYIERDVVDHAGPQLISWAFLD